MIASHDDFLKTQCPEVVAAVDRYAIDVQRSAEANLTPRLTSLVRLAIALSIPNRDMAKKAIEHARKVASDGEIAETVFVACELKAGAATAYGRLVFKFTDSHGCGSDSHDPSADRVYMKHFEKANPEAFASLIHRINTAHNPSSRLTPREYELIAVACATISRCLYCIEKHSRDAKEAGATDRDLADVVHLVVASRIDGTLAEWAAFTIAHG
ncbi:MULTISPECIES: carboxymuconolactone decarboxylase family protein [Burkholderia cepacia complex]|uniref:carboxymuconolactone decarboxylase family protein n=1 Tax=Burkholderia cepacia complex TaxID=87882 RepID=UPI001CF36DC7|nr:MULTISPECIES: carboxymuconolactone decarboxylase family protein [Burkholderia cepacia complex]MCA8057373.1 carboxymuconolactone decarboxylase family protein [Burkholderia cepacia]MDN7535198.1 carboxymuconolactone decarboxylase family protein [Burkholderia orbicola]